MLLLSSGIFVLLFVSFSGTNPFARLIRDKDADVKQWPEEYVKGAIIIEELQITRKITILKLLPNLQTAALNQSTVTNNSLTPSNIAKSDYEDVYGEDEDSIDKDYVYYDSESNKTINTNETNKNVTVNQEPLINLNTIFNALFPFRFNKKNDQENTENTNQTLSPEESSGSGCNQIEDNCDAIIEENVEQNKEGEMVEGSGGSFLPTQGEKEKRFSDDEDFTFESIKDTSAKTNAINASNDWLNTSRSNLENLFSNLRNWKKKVF